MNAPTTIMENVRYIESFGSGWVQAVLMRKVDIDLLEKNRRRYTTPLSIGTSAARSNERKVRLSFFGRHFLGGSAVTAESPRVYLAKQFSNASLRSLAERILGEADLRTGDLRWRTELRNGQPSIAGSDECSVDALGALAHELGHCLYERRNPPSLDIRAQIHSEAMAMAFEEWFVREALPMESRASWHAHQRKIDEFNEAFSNLELGSASAEFVEPHLLPLRESYYTAFGYQQIYFEASKARRGSSRLKVGCCA